MAYRNNNRYIEELKEVDISISADREINLKNNGVYIITGGTGGIGLEIANYLSLKVNAHIILISRTNIFNKENSKEKGVEIYFVNKLNKIKQIRNRKCKVEYYCADIGNLNQLTGVFKTIKNKYKKINGIFHCAGIAGDGLIIKKDIRIFQNVLSPKVEGTVYLDLLTKDYDIDFFVNFSSITSISGEIGQSDYSAANSFLDNYTNYRNRVSKNTITINWPAWKKIGMAEKYGATKKEDIFYPLLPKEAISLFDIIFHKQLSNVIIGKINLPKLNKVFLPFKVSPDIAILNNDYLDKSNKKESEKKDNTGKSDPMLLTEIERKIYNIWIELLEINAFDINSNFNDIGGNSIFAIHLFNQLKNEFPNILGITDIFAYPSVKKLASYIEGKSDKIQTNTIYENENSNTMENNNDGIEDHLIKLANGTIDIDEANRLIKL